jgi:hypothetical protein
METAMTKFREKAQAQVKQAVGQMVGDDQLVLEGKKQQRDAEHENAANDPSVAEGQEQPKEKERAQDAPTTKVNKSASSKRTRDPAGRKGPVLE